ncbi:MAG: hypothetical protein KDD47_24765, partial [Acidobacteria bacterium]|nr:hypothetical protein [Acidobacteriota bacterium]
MLESHALRSWALFNQEENLDPSKLTIPALPPGPYTACLVHISGGTLLNSPIRPEEGRCVDGFLAPQDALSLALPAPESGSEG